MVFKTDSLIEIKRQSLELMLDLPQSRLEDAYVRWWNQGQVQKSTKFSFLKKNMAKAVAAIALTCSLFIPSSSSNQALNLEELNSQQSEAAGRISKEAKERAEWIFDGAVKFDDRYKNADIETKKFISCCEDAFIQALERTKDLFSKECSGFLNAGLKALTNPRHAKQIYDKTALIHSEPRSLYQIVQDGFDFPKLDKKIIRNETARMGKEQRKKYVDAYEAKEDAIKTVAKMQSAYANETFETILFKEALAFYEKFDSKYSKIVKKRAEELKKEGILNENNYNIFINGCKEWPLIKAHSEYVGIHPFIAYFHFGIESGYDEDEVNSKGDDGVAQLSPEMQRKLANTHYDDPRCRHVCDRLWEYTPNNILFGSWHFRNKLENAGCKYNYIPFNEKPSKIVLGIFYYAGAKSNDGQIRVAKNIINNVQPLFNLLPYIEQTTTLLVRKASMNVIAAKINGKNGKKTD